MELVHDDGQLRFLCGCNGLAKVQIIHQALQGWDVRSEVQRRGFVQQKPLELIIHNTIALSKVVVPCFREGFGVHWHGGQQFLAEMPTGSCTQGNFIAGLRVWFLWVAKLELLHPHVLDVGHAQLHGLFSGPEGLRLKK